MLIIWRPPSISADGKILVKFQFHLTIIISVFQIGRRILDLQEIPGWAQIAKNPESQAVYRRMDDQNEKLSQRD